ncbi:MAG: HD-GYP domain-containing protein [Methylomonas sp.]
MFEQENDQLGMENAELIKVEVGDLKIGMYVSKLDRPWLETRFWFQGFELRTQNDIEAVRSQCLYVYVDAKKKMGVEPVRPRTIQRVQEPYKAQPSAAYNASIRFHDFQNRTEQALARLQINQARVLHRHTSHVVSGFMEEARFGRSINTLLAKKTVARCVDTLFEAPNTLMLMTQLKEKDAYTAQHSMNVCIFSIAIGRQMGLSKLELNNLGLCGMMHDMGKMVIPIGILDKPARLTQYEMQIMQSHATEGKLLLTQTQGMELEAIQVAYMHHERLDGVGYPCQLRAWEITPYAQMVAIADIYDAMTSNRVYQKGMSHLEAIKVLTDSAQEGHLNLQYTQKFIECLGVYPVGCLVELASGESGLVLEVNPLTKLKPKIMIVTDANKTPCNEFILDLSMMSENSGGPVYTIKRIMPADECPVDLFKYYASGLVKGFDFLKE